MLKTNAFVLRRHDFREADRMYTVYSEEYGKIALLARGARKIKSKLAPHLESFGEVRVNFAKGKIFTHLSGASVLRHHKAILKDASRIDLVSHCFRLLDKFVKDDEADTEIYGLLEEAMSAANEAPEAGFQKIRVYFFWRLIDFLGYRPQLDECALCGKIIRQEATENRELWLNLTENIIICKDCTGDGLLIKNETLEGLKKIFDVGLGEFLKYDFDNAIVAVTEKAKQIKLSEL
jgi:DNA repair protein RecO (recombination protein O)